MGIYQSSYFIGITVEKETKIINEKEISLVKYDCSTTLLTVQNVA